MNVGLPEESEDVLSPSSGQTDRTDYCPATALPVIGPRFYLQFWFFFSEFSVSTIAHRVRSQSLSKKSTGGSELISALWGLRGYFSYFFSHVRVELWRAGARSFCEVNGPLISIRMHLFKLQQSVLSIAVFA